MAQTPYDRFLDAKIQMSEQTDQNTSTYQKASTEMWSAILDAVRLHRVNGTAIPQEMTFDLEQELSYWVSGVPSHQLPLLTRRGRKISPAVRSCHLVAVMYLVGARELEGDHRFRQTVRELFRISESTLQGWKNKYHEEARSAFSEFRKDMGREDRMRGITVLLAASAKQYHSLIKRQKPKRRS